jgi:ribosomal-protein-alanine N-acetyltransferase
MLRSHVEDDSAPVESHPERMSVADVPEVAALEKRIFSDPWSADSFLAEVERREEIGCPLVVRDAGGIAAYAVVWFLVDEIHIGNLAVRPDRQGRGLGSSLLAYVLDEGRRRGMTYATLEVRCSNTRAIALYERFGFRQVGLRRNYYRDNREDAKVLACELDSRSGRWGHG